MINDKCKTTTICERGGIKAVVFRDKSELKTLLACGSRLLPLKCSLLCTWVKSFSVNAHYTVYY